MNKKCVTDVDVKGKRVLIDRSGDLWLIDFSTPALRTSHSEIEPELCAGYAAPIRRDTPAPSIPWRRGCSLFCSVAPSRRANT